MTTRIYTKTGDKGETGLFGGKRVSKDDARVEAYGEVDELNAALGLARAMVTESIAGAGPSAAQASSSSPSSSSSLSERLGEVQSLLFTLGTQLATPPERGEPMVSIAAADIAMLEHVIDEAQAQLPPLKSFILPGGSSLASALHVARCVCRRAERRVVALRHQEPETPEVAIVFLNRLSDLLFVWARLANHLAGVADVPWTARAQRAR